VFRDDGPSVGDFVIAPCGRYDLATTHNTFTSMLAIPVDSSEEFVTAMQRYLSLSFKPRLVFL